MKTFRRWRNIPSSLGCVVVASTLALRSRTRLASITMAENDPVNFVLQVWRNKLATASLKNLLGIPYPATRRSTRAIIELAGLLQGSEALALPRPGKPCGARIETILMTLTASNLDILPTHKLLTDAGAVLATGSMPLLAAQIFTAGADREIAPLAYPWA